MKKILVLCLLAIAVAHAQTKERVAIIPSIGDYDTQSLMLLAKKAEEIAVRILPPNNFIIIKQDEVRKKIGDSTFFEMCKEGSCVGDIAKEVNANYGMRCAIFKIEGKLVLQFELYREDNTPIETFIDYNAKDFFGMLAVLEERLPDAFRKIIPSVHEPQSSDKIFTDSRDGKKYKIVKIGTQTWFAENLNFDYSGSKCYDNKTANCDKYGRLYNWNTAMKSCPSGWHLPTNAEWDKLYRYVDGSGGMDSPYYSYTAGRDLKAASGWNNYKGNSGNGTDAYGFAALPGSNGYSDGYFDYDVGDYGNWWSASEYNAYDAYYQFMSYNYEQAGYNDCDKSNLFSIRCVKD